jgi:type I restriction enzyme, S subunit
MDVKPGYKQTEVGVVPEDWEVKPLSEVTGYTNGKAHEGNISDFGKYVVVNSKFISTNGEVRKYSDQRFSPASKGEILMVMSDVPNGRAIARCFFADRDDLYTVNQRICALRPLQIDGKLLFYKLNRNPFYLAFDDGVKQTNLRKGDVLSCPLALPPTKVEQETIAEALSDADALIESLEQLIAKKRQIKQGAMQELLTGKKRLPGFSGEWSVKRLAQLADIRSGGTPSTTQPQFWDGDVLWCTPTDITALHGFKYLSDTSRKISQAGLKSSSAEIIPANSVVMTSRATIGECAINRVPVSTNQGFKNFTPFEDADVEFLYYLLLTQKQGFINLCGGSTFLEIGKAQLAAFEVRVPTRNAEQASIAAILSDMDSEIATLEAKLAKAHQLKQGMMQELLTGRIRLPVDRGRATE